MQQLIQWVRVWVLCIWMCIHDAAAASSLSLEELHRRYQSEKGLRRLITVVENIFGHGTPSTSPPADPKCSSPSGRCLTREQFRLPSKMVSFKEFLAAPPSSVLRPIEPGRTGNTDRNWGPAWPMVQMIPFFALADYRYGHSCTHACEYSSSKKRLIVRARVFNRSLVYMNFNDFEVVRLRAFLRVCRAHNLYFFLISTELDGHNDMLYSEIVKSKHILRVFVTHLHGNGSKMYSVPLGLPTHFHKNLLDPVPFDFFERARRRSKVLPAKLVTTKFDLGTRLLAARYGRRRALLSILKRRRELHFRQWNISGKINYTDFFALIQDHSFFLSPSGSGIDTFRTWEVLLLGRVPVVNTLPDSRLWEELPVAVMRHDWTDLSKQTLEGLWQLWYASAERQFNVERLFMPFWIMKVLHECLSVP
eukprot:NODE_466_length_1363_cov_227.510654_g335_i0.p1 GENE.NODE_466_length_1363_cov_227.510654_g335_i0~~NODE_466_length_1363_cov_227.510654_g335_i0.p1  ORF type:complete len:420 (+),score=47.18 NODE_466_length_1363_cov_227.510654_g335_i0:63-1322(+)